MKMIITLILTACIILMFCGNSFSEPYNGSGFPAEQQLAKSINKANCGFKKSIGKFKKTDGSYLLYYDSQCRIFEATIIPLDTGIWMADNQIIQK